MEPLYKVSAYTADGDLINKWEHLDRPAAEAVKATMEQGTDKDISCEISEQSLETRAQTLVRLGQMMHHLPAAKGIDFSNSHPDQLQLSFGTFGEVDEWAAEIAATAGTVDSSSKRHRSASVMWRGWWVTLSALEALPARPTQDDPFADYGPNPGLHFEVSGSRDGDVQTKVCNCTATISGSAAEAQAMFADHVATGDAPAIPVAEIVSAVPTTVTTHAHDGGGWTETVAPVAPVADLPTECPECGVPVEVPTVHRSDCARVARWVAERTPAVPVAVSPERVADPEHRLRTSVRVASERDGRAVSWIAECGQCWWASEREFAVLASAHMAALDHADGLAEAPAQVTQ